MENIEKKTPLNDLMDTTMDKIRDMVDSNTRPLSASIKMNAAAQVRASRSTPSRSSSSRTV